MTITQHQPDSGSLPSTPPGRTRSRAGRASLLGRRAATFAGITWLALGLESIVRPGPHDYRTALWVIPWAGTTLAIAFLHRLHDGGGGRWERAGYWINVLGAPVVAGGDLLLLRSGSDGGAAAIAAAVWTAGLVAYGIGLVRGGRVRPWAGWAVIASQPLTVAAAAAMSPLVPLQDKGSYSGAVMHGLAWLIVAAALTERRRPAARARAG